MLYYLLDIKSVVIIDGKETAFDYLNTYTSFNDVIKSFDYLGCKDNIADASIHEWELKSDGSSEHTGRVWTYKDLQTMDSKNQHTSESDKDVISTKILSSNMTDDLKLFEIFSVWADLIRKTNIHLYYALLGWKDVHLNTLMKEKYHINISKLHKKAQLYDKYRCTHCNGTGRRLNILADGVELISCPYCKGTGTIISNKIIDKGDDED